LQLQGGDDRRRRAVEDTNGAVALTLGLYQAPSVVDHHRGDKPIMGGEGSRHRLVVLFLPQAGRASISVSRKVSVISLRGQAADKVGGNGRW
jgi:hypothetical protein